jgi:predicted nucleotidyltransferase
MESYLASLTWRCDRSSQPARISTPQPGASGSRLMRIAAPFCFEDNLASMLVRSAGHVNWREDGMRLGDLTDGVKLVYTAHRMIVSPEHWKGAALTVPHVSRPKCLPEAIERIVRQFDPLRIILFGSWARGQARPDSDLDLLVVLPHVENKRLATVQILRALNGLPVSKDVVVTTPEEIAERGNIIGNVLRPALREGEVLYERA